jgi:hypothetical protein
MANGKRLRIANGELRMVRACRGAAMLRPYHAVHTDLVLARSWTPTWPRGIVGARHAVPLRRAGRGHPLGSWRLHRSRGESRVANGEWWDRGRGGFSTRPAATWRERRRVASGERRNTANSEWRIAKGKRRRVASGEWRVVSGKIRRIANSEWRMVNGERRRAASSERWKTASGEASSWTPTRGRLWTPTRGVERPFLSAAGA